VLGFVVATHGSLSDGLVDAAKLIVGEVENTVTVNLVLGDDIEALNAKIAAGITRVDQGDGVIVFTDLLSASPYNQGVIAISNLPEEKRNETYLLTGVSLPMFIEAINQQMIGTKVEDAVDTILAAASEGVTKWSASEMSAVDDEDDF
jgi:PTS system mannose-specific IIA component